jgi:hypothetical protein
VAASSMRKRSFVKDAQPVSGGARLGYARVSKGDEQTNLLQAKALRAAGCRRVFEEAASGGRWDRPELHRMLDHLREGDTVVVWKLDRLSRSLKDVLHIMERIAQAGAGFLSITENIDTTTPAGRMMMQMVGAFAQGSRIKLAGNDLEHVVVVPSGLFAPPTKAGLTAAICGDEVEGDFA